MSRLSFLLLALAGPAAAEPMCVNAPVPGFAAGQARLADRLAPGRAVEVALRPADAVRFPVPSGRPAKPGTFGAVLPLQVPAAGTYRLLLGAHAWIDLVRDGVAVPSVEHAHGAPCSGVAKIVAFQLAPGRYEVELSEAEVRALTVKVSRELLLPAGR